jgi:recombination protein RecA
MPAAAFLRDQLEAVLAPRIPGAFSPKPNIVREVVPTGVRGIDDLLQGGFPASAITEVVGSECSGRTSLALSLIARLTRAGKICAWVDVSDALHPESAASAGVDLPRLLWIRCGVDGEDHAVPVSHPVLSSEICSAKGPAKVPEKYFIARPAIKGLHGGGFGPHPRNEVKGLSQAVASLLGKEKDSDQQIELLQTTKPIGKKPQWGKASKSSIYPKKQGQKKPWSRLDQALRATDLLLQNGGFAAIVLDMASIAPEHA